MDLLTGEVHVKEAQEGEKEKNTVLAFLRERLGEKEEGGVEEKGIELSKIGEKKEEKTNVNESSSSDSETD